MPAPSIERQGERLAVGALRQTRGERSLAGGGGGVARRGPGGGGGLEIGMAEAGGAAGRRRGGGNPAAVAIKVEHTGIRRQPGDENAIVALVKKPAGLLPGKHIG